MADNMRDMTLNLIVNSQVGKLKDFNNNLNNTNKNITKTTSLTNALGRSFRVLFGAYLGVQGVRNIVDTYRKLDLIRQSLNGLAGGAEAGARQFEYLRKEAFRTATDFTTIAEKYKNFYAAASGAGFDETQTQTMFSGLLTAGRALGANKSSIGGALLAVEQMLSKGRVSMEELRRQLGNAYAGAIQVAARAMGVVPEQFEALLKKGISSKEFVPKLTAQFEKEFKESLKEAVQSLDAEMVRLGNAWQYLVLRFGDSGAGREFAKLIRQITTLLSSPKLVFAIEGLGKALNVLMEILRFAIQHLKDVLFLMSPVLLGAAITGTINGIVSLVKWLQILMLNLSATQKWMIAVFTALLFLEDLIKTFIPGSHTLLKDAIFGSEGIEGGQRIANVLKEIGLALGGIATLWLMFSKNGRGILTGGALAGLGIGGATGVAESAGAYTTTNAAKGSLIERINRASKAVDKEIAANSRKVKLARAMNVGKKVGGKTLGLAGRGLFGTLGAIMNNPWVLIAGTALESNLNLPVGEKDNWYEKYGLRPNVGGRLEYVSPQLSKTETYAPNITYNPQYQINASTMTPEQLREVLDERDRNFWTSLTGGIPKFSFGGNKK